jgi:hypothetical protein
LCAGQDSNLRRPKPTRLQRVPFDRLGTGATAALYPNYMAGRISIYGNGTYVQLWYIQDMSDPQHKRRRAQTIKILKMVALGILLVGIGAVPPPWAIPRIIRELTSKDAPENRRRLRRKILDLKHQGYIAENAGSYSMTERGEKIMREENLWELKIPTPKQWAGAWHLVVFDIPAEKSRFRIPFIRHLQNLGLVFYQRSVWIYPHPMEDDVHKIANFYGISTYVSFITATSIDGAPTLKRKFKIA